MNGLGFDPGDLFGSAKKERIATWGEPKANPKMLKITKAIINNEETVL